MGPASGAVGIIVVDDPGGDDPKGIITDGGWWLVAGRGAVASGWWLVAVAGGWWLEPKVVHRKYELTIAVQGDRVDTLTKDVSH